MDRSFNVTDELRDEQEAVKAKLRFDSFKLGAGLPPSGRPLSLTMPNPNPKSRHARSHSRTASQSSAPSLHIQSQSLSMNDMTSSSFASSATLLPSAANTKRQSHHRRRSSVSTRRESAEMMGVTLPDLPSSVSEDNLSLNDKDSIRRRALWALEGKADMGFTKVEIPEFDSPSLEKKLDFPSKPVFGAGTGSFGSMNGIMNKRDSFGKHQHLVSSSKDVLGTLIEEEEEDENDDNNSGNGFSASKASAELIESPMLDTTTVTATPKPVVPVPQARPRPASLNLRPLSLTADALITAPTGLPTPTLTPGPRSGLKSLTLASSTQSSSSQTATATVNKRQSVVSPLAFGSVQSITQVPSASCEVAPQPKRRSSISYKRSSEGNSALFGLPTPEMTPVSDRHTSLSSSDDDFQAYRPLSTSEQHFLFKQHQTLIQRITDLERALSLQSRARSRPASLMSDGTFSSSSSSVASSEPTDEMLQLVADLKAERDELKRDADGWRTRVADLEKQLGVLAGRIDIERREAWIARSRLGLLEVEKLALERALDEKLVLARQAAQERDALKLQNERMNSELVELRLRAQRGDELQEEVGRLGSMLRAQQDERDLLLKRVTALEAAQSTSSESTPSWGIGNTGISIMVTSEDEDDDNGLTGYEDEDEDDDVLDSPTSSWASREELDATDTTITSATKMNHARHATLSRTWTFPRGSHASHAAAPAADEVDRFFGCLDDAVDVPMSTAPIFPDNNPFAVGYKFGSSCDDAIDTDDMPPFLIPSNVGEEIESDAESCLPTTPRTLEAVLEEEEEEVEVEKGSVKSKQPYDDDEFNGEEVEGGIKFVFSAPALRSDDEAALTSTAPLWDSSFESDDHIDEFDESFGRDDSPVPSQAVETGLISPPHSDAGDSPLPLFPRVASPSSIPRPKAFRSALPSPVVISSPPRSAVSTSKAGTSYITPPSKRAIASPSFIPQPRSSRRPATPTKQQPATSLRKPLMKNGPQTDDARTCAHDFFSLSSYRSPHDTAISENKANRRTAARSPLTSLTTITTTTNNSSAVAPPPVSSRISSSLASLPSLIPFSWTPSSSRPPSSTSKATYKSRDSSSSLLNTAVAGAGEALVRSFFGHAIGRTWEGREEVPRPNAYVSREKQLERLKRRMEDEEKMKRLEEQESHCQCYRCGDMAVCI